MARFVSFLQFGCKWFGDTIGNLCGIAYIYLMVWGALFSAIQKEALASPAVMVIVHALHLADSPSPLQYDLHPHLIHWKR